MRSYVVFTLLLLMAGALGVSLALRQHTEHFAAAPPARALSDPSASGSALASGGAVVIADGATTTMPADASVAGRDASVAARMNRPLRVTSLGWELLAPGIIANQGATPGSGSAFAADGLTVHLASVDEMAAVEDALARGGTDPQGADVAIVPLPTFVASFERLRALSPEVFFVVGFSRGREGLRSGREGLLSREGPGATDLRVGGPAGSAATFVTLFALELAGVPLARVELVPEARAASAPIAAADRASVDEVAGHVDTSRRLLLTTADASRLVPFVAIAPHGFIEAHPEALRSLAHGWLVGAERLRADVPSAARTVAQANQAPTAVVLLHRLGLIESASLRDNARLAGLAGRGAVTLERLFQRTWHVWRAVGVLTSPVPEVVPLSTATVTALVRSDAALRSATPTTPVTPPGATVGPSAPPAGATPVLVRRATEARFDEPAFVDELGFIAGVFDRAPLRVSIRGADAARTRTLLTNARDRFDIAPARLFAGRAVPSGSVAAIEVLSVP